jgi:NAD(P)H-flavin reductase
LITIYQVGKFLYQNNFLSSRPKPRATITCRPIQPPIAGNKEGSGKGLENDTGRIIKIRVTLGRPLGIGAGQCIHLWMPSVSLGSWMQSHPFVVTSWSPEKQTTLELFVQVHRGFTATLHQRASATGSASFCAFVIGPFGISHSLSQYETVVAVASNAGIAGVVPYLKQLLYSYNTLTGQIRRLHLVWEVDTLGK